MSYFDDFGYRLSMNRSKLHRSVAHRNPRFSALALWSMRSVCAIKYRLN